MTISLQFHIGFARPSRRLDYCPSFPASTFDVCADLVQVRFRGGMSSGDGPRCKPKNVEQIQAQNPEQLPKPSELRRLSLELEHVLLGVRPELCTALLVFHALPCCSFCAVVTVAGRCCRFFVPHIIYFVCKARL